MRAGTFVFALHTLAADALVAERSKVIPSEAYIEVQTDPEGVTWPWRVFKTTNSTPPNISITTNGGELADGSIFMTPATSNLSVPFAKENTGFIMTQDNELVFALENVDAPTDFRCQTYKDKQYLTYWSGYNSQGTNVGHGYGATTFLDDTYASLVVNPSLGLDKLTNTANPAWSTDIHEQEMTPRNTLLISSYNNTPWDLTSVGGSSDGWIVDGQVHEIEIETGEVLWSWHALDYLPLNASHQSLVTPAGTAGNESNPWDWFHINSIQAVGSDVLINARHHWATYLVSGKDGSIIWSLEGETGGSFGALPEEGTFRWQHFARAHNVSDTSLDFSLFDNHNAAIDNGTTATRGLVYHLELPASKSYKPRLLRRIESPAEVYADSQGSYVASLSNGNQLMGYGQIATTREYGPAADGSDLRWEGQFGGINGVQSYRAFKETWSATPAAWNPVLVVESGKAYVSWNGATEVESWTVYAGKTGSSVASVGTALKKGFETVFDVPKGAAFIQLAAVQGGTEVRKSNVAAVSGVLDGK